MFWSFCNSKTFGGIIGAQIGARLVEHVSTASFKKIFAAILIGLTVYLFFSKN